MVGLGETEHYPINQVKHDKYRITIPCVHVRGERPIVLLVFFPESEDDDDDKEVTSPADKGGGGGGGSSGDSSNDEQDGSISECVCLSVCLSIIHEPPFVIFELMFVIFCYMHFTDISLQSACPSYDMFLVVEETVTG